MTQNSDEIINRAAVLNSDEEAIAAARHLAGQAKGGAVERDQQRIYPIALLNQFSALGLGSISVPRELGGAGLSYQTMAEVFRLISASDPSLGQIPQNHFGLIQFILGEGSAAQQQRLLSAVVQGKRLGNGGPPRRKTPNIRKTYRRN
ncbi:alkylation response protein AidB-like acyl-CoA dehydrogenase [Pantoea sp. SORGH_AS 659]|nr:alkylation response protein AidB-like acyl-CoA dehydrogenase [Pantoea sp. SORGH_AS_0659]